MHPERWQQVKRLFDEALEKDGPERAAFLDQACSQDSELRREVQSLLDNCGDDTFLENPAHAIAPELLRSIADRARVGKQLGPYEVVSEIGHGGMGIVYLARDKRLDRLVALKMLAPEYTSSPQYRERLKREARAAARLSDPGIATVYSLEEFDDSLCIVSEYVEGSTLLKLLSEGPLAFPRLLDVAIQIARALSAAHERGIVHRDLKPENVVITASGLVKILDFGLARIQPLRPDTSGDPRLTRSGMFLGTPAYASPEQLLGAEVDHRTDIFSFGVLLYELAAGRHPFGAADAMSTIARILEGKAVDLRIIRPSIPTGFEKVLRRCLQKRPSDRYSSTRDLLAELEHVQQAAEPRRELKHEGNSALWWWQFHQACAAFGYYGMLYPMWRVKQWLGGVEGSLFFFPALVAVGIASNLRFHLWFTSRFYVSELSYQRRKVAPWIRAADWLFVFALAAAAVRIHTMHAIIATLLMSVAVGSLVAFSLIEPTTTRAALDRNTDSHGRTRTGTD